MILTDDQKKHYQNVLAFEKAQIEDFDQQIEEELAKVKDRLADLQASKKAARQMYDAACRRLGIPNDLEEHDDEDDGAEL